MVGKMKTAFIKNILREIKTSFGRFISIAVMLLLGTFAYVGIKSAGPDMRHTLNEFTKETNMSHIFVQFTNGIEEQDEKNILNYEELSDAEFLKAIELKTKEEDNLMNLIELPERISIPKIMEGRYPNKEGEILLDYSLINEYKIGEKISFRREEQTLKFTLDNLKEKDSDKNKKDEEKELRLNNYTYEIVGFVITPEFLGVVDKGQSFSKYGEYYSFGYIIKDNFKEIKDEKENLKTQIAYLKFKNLDDMKVSDLGFEARSIRHKEYLEELFAERPDEIFNEMNDNILIELKKAEEDIEKGKKEFKDAEEEIIKNKIKIENSWEEYNDGYNDFNYEITLAENKIKDGRDSLKDGEEKYLKGLKEFNTGKKEYESGKKEYDKGLDKYRQAKIDLDNAEEQLKILKENKNDFTLLKTMVENEINLKTKIDRYDELNDLIEVKEAEREIAILEGNDILANELLVEINALQNEIDGLGNINSLRIQYSTIQSIKSSFNSYQRGIYLLEYNNISTGKPSYIQGLIDSIPNLEEQVLNGKSELDKNKKILDKTKKDLDKAKKELDANEKLLSKSKIEIDESKRKIEISDAKLSIEREYGLGELEENKLELEKAEKKLKDAEKTFSKEKIKAEKELSNAEKEIKKAKDDIKKIDKPLCIFNTRYDNTNYYMFYDSSVKIDLLANVFPPFLFLIALLVSLTAMTRMVDEQRQEIGTYKALGYKNREIAFKYVLYGGIASTIGGIIGVGLGSEILSKIVFDAYSITFVLKERLHVPNIYTGLTAMILAVLSTALAAYLSVKKYLNSNSANLMRPKVEKPGKKTIFERLKFIWKRLPFLVKVTLRNVFRYKGRMLMTIIGVGGCTGLLFFGFSLRYSMAELLPRQSQNITKIDFIVSFNEIIDKDESEEFKILMDEDDRINISSEIYSEPLIHKNSKSQRSELFLIVPKDLEKFKEQINLIDSRTNKEKINSIPKTEKKLIKKEKDRLKDLRKERKQDIISLDKDSAIFTERFLAKNGKELGENIFIEDIYGKEYKLEIGKPAINYISHFAYMTPEYFDKNFNKSTETNSYLISLKDDVNIDEFKEEILNYTIVTNVIDMRFEEINSWVSTIDIVVIIVSVISGILAFVVLYNLTYINLSERIREISTIKVLGFYSIEVIRYIYSETAILTAIGIAFGYLFGNMIYYLIGDLIIPDNLNLYTKNVPYIYIGASAITLVFFGIVGLIINKKLKKVDMIEALKGFE